MPPPDARSAPGEDEPLLDYAVLTSRLRRVAAVLLALAALGAGLEAAGSGWSAGLAVRWLTTLVAGVLVSAAVLTAVQALGGADRAQRRGERLASGDVGLLPARRRGEDEG